MFSSLPVISLQRDQGKLQAITILIFSLNVFFKTAAVSNMEGAS